MPRTTPTEAATDADDLLARDIAIPEGEVVSMNVIRDLCARNFQLASANDALLGACRQLKAQVAALRAKLAEREAGD